MAEWADFRTHFSAELSEESLQAMALFLAEVGVITWFNSPGLKNLIVIDPKWLADLMATIVSFKYRWSRGLVTLSNLHSVWHNQPAFPPSMHATLIHLLEQFEVMFLLAGMSSDTAILLFSYLPPPSRQSNHYIPMPFIHSPPTTTHIGRSFGFVCRILLEIESISSVIGDMNVQFWIIFISMHMQTTMLSERLHD